VGAHNPKMWRGLARLASAGGTVGALAYAGLASPLLANAEEPIAGAPERKMTLTVPHPTLKRNKTVAEATEDLSRVRKRIAVFGGSFNPITNAHLNCAAEIIHSKLADEVWITPCGSRPDKPSLRTSGLHRLIMCHLAVDTTFGSRFGVKVCDEEMSEPRNIPSLVLMRRLRARYPEYDFSFVVGSDLVPTLEEWDAPALDDHWEGVKEAGKVFMQETHFLVIDRPGETASDIELGGNFELIAPALEARGSRLTETLLSSTEVRNRMRGADDIVRYGLRKGGMESEHRISERRSWYDEVEGLLPPSVLGHIVRYGLYARDE